MSKIIHTRLNVTQSVFEAVRDTFTALFWVPRDWFLDKTFQVRGFCLSVMRQWSTEDKSHEHALRSFHLIARFGFKAKLGSATTSRRDCFRLEIFLLSDRGCWSIHNRHAWREISFSSAAADGAKNLGQHGYLICFAFGVTYLSQLLACRTGKTLCTRI